MSAVSDWRVSRLSNALLAALVLHGLLFLVRTRPALRASESAMSAPPELVEIEESSVEATLPQSAPAPGESLPAPQSGNQRPAVVALRGGNRAPSSNEPGAAVTTGADTPSNELGSGAAGPAPAASAAEVMPKVDLGLDGHFFMGPPSEQLPRVRKPGVQRQLEASLSADDVAHGLARGNALLSSLHAAVRDTGPVRGEALVRVTVGADGSLTDVEFLQGAAADWSTALKSFRELATRKRVRLPAGARGLRVTYQIKAKVQLPSGEEVKGVNVAGPSLLPNGLTLHGTFDLADLGGGAQRLVYARVVSEEVL